MSSSNRRSRESQSRDQLTRNETLYTEPQTSSRISTYEAPAKTTASTMPSNASISKLPNGNPASSNVASLDSTKRLSSSKALSDDDKEEEARRAREMALKLKNEIGQLVGGGRKDRDQMAAALKANKGLVDEKEKELDKKKKELDEKQKLIDSLTQTEKDLRSEVQKLTEKVGRLQFYQEIIHSLAGDLGDALTVLADGAGLVGQS